MFAQEITISGIVTDKTTANPIPEVIVTLRDTQTHQITKFTRTNEEGIYSFQLSGFPSNTLLNFSILNYASESVSIIKGQIQYNIELSEKVTELKEVKIVAPSINQHGDTINYLLSKFASTNDKTLADVLKRMPGIDVSENGEIKYNGVSINKFYIEGKDMLEDKYGLATNNIQQNDVGSVQVLENHQPIKALENISFSQSPAINIKLKEDAKSRWVGTVKAGAGFTPFVWDLGIFAMRFTKHTQLLNTYKTNNIGVDITKDLYQMSVSDFEKGISDNYQLKNNFSVSPDYLKDIDDERTNFNKTHLASTNNLWTIKNKYDLTSKISYLNNNLISDNYTTTSYFLNESTVVTLADENSTENQQQINADITLNGNTPTYYIKNKLTANIKWENTNIDIDGTYPNTQLFNSQNFQLSNKFDLLKKIDKKIFSFHSSNQFQKQPQFLKVTKDNLIQEQLLTNLAFYTNTFTSFAFHLNPFTFSVKTGFSGLIRNLESNLTGISDTIGSLNNDLTVRYLKLYLFPELEYKKNSFELRLNTPVSFIPLEYKNYSESTSDYKADWYLSPLLYMKYTFSPRLNISFSGSITKNALMEQSLYSGMLLNNYMNISKGTSEMESGNCKNLFLGLYYKNPLKTFFTNIYVQKLWNYSPRIPNMRFVYDYIISSYIDGSSNSNSLSMGANISKGIDFIKGIIVLKSDFWNYQSIKYQNNEKTPYGYKTWSISSKVTTKATKWFSAVYEIKHSQNWLILKNSDVSTLYGNTSQSLKSVILFSDAFNIQLGGEYYFNKIINSTVKDLFLVDASLTYSLKNGMEFNLSAKNILNHKKYSYVVYNGLSEINKTYDIRPINVVASIYFRF